MPTQSTPIPAPQRQAIRDWIAYSGHRDRGQRVERDHGPLAAENQCGAGFAQVVEGERVGQALGPDLLHIDATVGLDPGIGVQRHLRRDHAQRGEAGQVARVDDLDVLDARATLARWVGLVRLLDGIEHRADRGVTDGVIAHVNAQLVGAADLQACPRLRKALYSSYKPVRTCSRYSASLLTRFPSLKTKSVTGTSSDVVTRGRDIDRARSGLKPSGGDLTRARALA